MNRALYGLVLLLVIASNAFVGVHAASHVTADVTECELCAAYSDPSDSIPVDRVYIPPIARQSHELEYLDPETARSVLLSVRQRAPPASID